MIENIFLITVDDLRADRLGYSNNQSDLTPNIDSFANDCVQCTHAFSTGPRTTLSFPGIIYGLYASQFFFQGKSHHFQNVSQVLHDADFLTASFNSNPHFKRWGYQKGFDLFEDFLHETGSNRKKASEKMKKKVMNIIGDNKTLSRMVTKALSVVSSDITLPYANGFKTNERCLNWVEKHIENDFFCWIHYMDPHYPFKPLKNYLNHPFSDKKIARLNRLHSMAEKYEADVKEKDRLDLISLYDAEVRLFDDAFGEFIDQLKHFDLYDDSLIICTADHGELFGDYGFYGHRFDVLYQNQLHVPLLIKKPGNKSTVIHHPVSLIDIPFTLLDEADVVNHSIAGKNLVDDKRDFVYSEGMDWYMRSSLNTPIDNQKIMVSCQNAQWKYIKDNVHQRKELFHLKKDERERKNVIDDHEQVCSNFDWLIEKHLSLMIKCKNIKTEKAISDLKKSGKI